MVRPRILLLFSGGLDSLIAARLLVEVGAEVHAVHFMTPFTGKESGLPGEEYLSEWGIDLKRIRISLQEYLPLLTSPPHGFGRALNPCIDCKILFLGKAKEMMEQEGSDAVATGEVLGERPMSQNRLSLDIIERESRLQGRLLRPLSALLLPETEVEHSGLIDRTRLLAIRGRGRKPQLELAMKWGITEFATPSGGCLITESQYSKKLRDLLEHPGELSEETVALLRLGRHFRHAESAKLIVGRNKEENEELLKHGDASRMFLEVRGQGSPIGLMDTAGAGSHRSELLLLASAIVARYSDAPNDSQTTVTWWNIEGVEETILVLPASHKETDKWRL